MEMLDLEVTIPEERVLRLQGYRRKDASPSPAVQALLQQEIEEAYKLIKPQACYHEMSAQLGEEGKVVLENGAILNVANADIEWKGLEIVWLALCTIGPTLEERSSQLFAQGEYAASIMLDSVGSAAVGNLVSQVDAMACERAQGSGMVAGPRFEPGAAGWPLTEQRILFSMLPADRLVVKLNEQCQMIPRKSVSLAIGMGKEVAIPRGRHTCWYCHLTSCPFRDPGAMLAK